MGLPNRCPLAESFRAVARSHWSLGDRTASWAIRLLLRRRVTLEILRGDREIRRREFGVLSRAFSESDDGATWQIGNVLDRAHGLQILVTRRGGVDGLEGLVSGCVAEVQVEE